MMSQAQIRMTDCINSPARLVAEATTGDRGEDILESILKRIGGSASTRICADVSIFHFLERCYGRSTRGILINMRPRLLMYALVLLVCTIVC
jgi:hypothetical protein